MGARSRARIRRPAPSRAPVDLGGGVGGARRCRCAWTTAGGSSQPLLHGTAVRGGLLLRPARSAGRVESDWRQHRRRSDADRLRAGGPACWRPSPVEPERSLDALARREADRAAGRRLRRARRGGRLGASGRGPFGLPPPLHRPARRRHRAPTRGACRRAIDIAPESPGRSPCVDSTVGVAAGTSARLGSPATGPAGRRSRGRRRGAARAWLAEAVVDAPPSSLARALRAARQPPVGGGQLGRRSPGPDLARDRLSGCGAAGP